MIKPFCPLVPSNNYISNGDSTFVLNNNWDTYKPPYSLDSSPPYLPQNKITWSCFSPWTRFWQGGWHPYWLRLNQPLKRWDWGTHLLRQKIELWKGMTWIRSIRQCVILWRWKYDKEFNNNQLTNNHVEKPEHSPILPNKLQPMLPASLKPAAKLIYK